VNVHLRKPCSEANTFHSSRINLDGPISSARRAGIQVAVKPNRAMVATTPSKTRGSRGFAPETIRLGSCVANMPSASPRVEPTSKRTRGLPTAGLHQLRSARAQRHTNARGLLPHATCHGQDCLRCARPCAIAVRRRSPGPRAIGEIGWQSGDPPGAPLAKLGDTSLDS
jgi:hypothetical protein